MFHIKYQGYKVMRKLPIGIQDFGKLRKGNHVYPKFYIHLSHPEL